MSPEFDTILEKLTPTLRRITHRLNGRFTFFNEEDLFQEALIHLWESYNCGGLSNKTDSYILQGCYFYLQNYIRASADKITPVSIDQPFDGQDGSRKDSIPDISYNAADDIDDALIKEYAEARLDRRELQIVELACDGLTIREIGIQLNISHVMVLKIKNRIRLKIRSIKKDLGYQE